MLLENLNINDFSNVLEITDDIDNIDFVDYSKEYVIYFYNALYNVHHYYPYYGNYDKQHYGEHDPVGVYIGEECAHVTLAGHPFVEPVEQVAHKLPVEHKAVYEIAHEYGNYSAEDYAAGKKFKTLAETHYNAENDKQRAAGQNNNISRQHKITLVYLRILR